MRVRLAYKIFIAFFVTSLAMVVLMTGVMRYFAMRNFEDFVNRVDMERLTEVVLKLETAYRGHDNWNFVRGNPTLFRGMLRPVPPELGPRREMHFGGPVDMGHPESPPEMHPPMPNHPELHIEERISLFDEHMKTVAGRADSTDEHILKRIVVDGKTVGWLGLKKRKDFTGPFESAFLYQQSQTFVIICLSALLLSALVSYLLSRHLLRPVGELARGADALASRQFDTRIHIDAGDELGQLADDFNRMAETLERYEHMRRQWISDISHELRTPLAVLRGEVEAVQDGVRKADEKTFESIHSEIMILGSLVDDLHELSMADSGNLSVKREPVNVMDVLEDAVKVFEPRLSQAGIAVEGPQTREGDISVSADRDRLFQVFSNILENSLRYTESPGRLKVWHEIRGADLHINFEDSEPGVPDGSLDRIFDRLYRVDESRSRKNGGTGLGLAICKGIVEAFGGRIRASRSSLRGLRIEIVLPMKNDA